MKKKTMNKGMDKYLQDLGRNSSELIFIKWMDKYLKIEEGNHA